MLGAWDTERSLHGASNVHEHAPIAHRHPPPMLIDAFNRTPTQRHQAPRLHQHHASTCTHASPMITKLGSHRDRTDPCALSHTASRPISASSDVSNSDQRLQSAKPIISLQSTPLRGSCPHTLAMDHARQMACSPREYRIGSSNDTMRRHEVEGFTADTALLRCEPSCANPGPSWISDDGRWPHTMRAGTPAPVRSRRA